MNAIEKQIFSKIELGILAGGLFGSRARGDAMAHSDYDVILISPSENEGSFYFIPEDRLENATHRICIFYRTPGQALTSLYRVDEDWPVRNAPFVHNRIVFDRNEYFPLFAKTVDQLDDDLFVAGYRETLNHAFEYLGKIKNMGHPLRTMEAARRFTDKLCKATALRNRYIFKDYCHYFPEIEAMPWVPDSLRQNMRGMAGYEGWSEQEIIQKSMETWNEYIADVGLIQDFRQTGLEGNDNFRGAIKRSFLPR